MTYQAIFSAPFGKLGIRCTEAALLGIDFLPPDMAEHAPTMPFAARVCAQLQAYCDDPDFAFDLPLVLEGTSHRLKVWQAMCAIPCGQVRTYGELAAELNSSPRAVGQACGANPVPVVVPCHRVVGKGGLGGFMHHAQGAPLDIKRWLLCHERVLHE